MGASRARRVALCSLASPFAATGRGVVGLRSQSRDDAPCQQKAGKQHKDAKTGASNGQTEVELQATVSLCVAAISGLVHCGPACGSPLELAEDAPNYSSSRGLRILCIIYY